MGRRKRKFEKNITDMEKFFSNLKYKDLKRECVIRGMPFELVISGDIPSLSSWLNKHFYDSSKHELLNDFDAYQENLITLAVTEKGQDPNDIIHPSLRLGYIAEVDEDGNVVKRKRVKTIFRRKRQKKDRTSDGIFSGTKKALTFSLQQEGLSKAKVIEKVLEAFPDASEKSVSIWFNKSKKLHK